MRCLGLCESRAKAGCFVFCIHVGLIRLRDYSRKPPANNSARPRNFPATVYEAKKERIAVERIDSTRGRVYTSTRR